VLSCQVGIGAPSETLSVFASNQSWSPVIVGGDADIVPVTTAVRADGTDVEPLPLLAVTTTRIVPPTSPEVTTYDAAVAPAMLAHIAPAESQRCHWYEYVSVPGPLHVPVDAVSVESCVALPEIAGGAVFAGPAAPR